ncbi:MAG TPA: FGGY family carbohydrate kinase [Flavisolibacter sp.]|nr:FGGY family carbohydrate kinase [Flavisolibacter sp.]
MKNENGYLVIDIGTGNVRVAVTDTKGTVLAVNRSDVKYHKDERYPDALYFEPDVLWRQIVDLAKNVLEQQAGVRIQAVTASSQREGIVLIDGDGGSLIGLSNHDHRGREWESIVKNPHAVYRLTGRYPTSLFSAMKLVAIRERRPEIFGRTDFILSISDWAQYQLCGVAGYEHSQASETLLYDVEAQDWSEELCAVFELNKQLLPPLHPSGRLLGKVLANVAAETSLSPDAVVIVGGADT